MKRYALECGVALSNGFSNPKIKKLQKMSKRYSVGAVCVYETEPCWIATASLDWFCSPGQSQTRSNLPTNKPMSCDHGCVVKPKLRKYLIEV